jgi:dTMP kinase
MHFEGGRRAGFFLTLEGPEGSGKSTQAQRLATRLADFGLPATVTREPGGTALGEEVRKILLHAPELRPVPGADALLFNAARAQLAAEVIEPALARGEVVICDRFADSTLAYQGYGAGRPIDGLRSLAAFAIGDLRPDLTVLIDLPVEDGLRRKVDDGEITRFESDEDVAFHRRVRDGFLELAKAEPARFVVVDGHRPPERIEAEIFAAILERLPRGGSVPSGGVRGESATTIPSESEPNPQPLRRER